MRFDPKPRNPDKLTRKALNRTAVRRGKPQLNKFRGKSVKRTGGKFILIASLAILFGILAIVYFYIIHPLLSGPEKPAEKTMQDFSIAGFDFIADKANRQLLYIKPNFNVNLEGLNGQYILSVTINLEVDNREKIARELNDQRAKFRRLMDDIVRTLKSYTYAELHVESGMNRLKDHLKARINNYLDSGKVIRVIFAQWPTFTRVLPKARTPG